MNRLQEILRAAKERSAALKAEKLATASALTLPPKETIIAESVAAMPDDLKEPIHYGIDRYGKTIVWNSDQWQFIEQVTDGKSAILIGAAGTGKTTTMRGSIEALIQSRFFPPMEDQHKHLPIGTPGIVCVSYTRRAVMNLRKALPEDLKSNCVTIHKLLEYQPVFYQIEDPVTGDIRNTMRFEPARNVMRKLTGAIKVVIIDESSMVSVDLFYKIWQALPDPMNVQFIFLGDIQQLPPIFGSAILGYKMLKLPVIELTQVYRQALESPIIRLAHRILSGTPIPVAEFPEWKFPDQLTLHPWKKKISADSALLTIAAFFKKGYDAEHYDPIEDMILMPFNKACGTIELNKHIANHIARKNKRVTHEVIAGFNKHYFSEGEKILFEKEDAVIVSIKRNPVYAGKWPQAASTLLDYWGCLQSVEGKESEHHITEEGEDERDIDEMLKHISTDDEEERVREASHVIKIRVIDSDREIDLKTAAELNALIMAYALTVHKSQGSEWRKVFFILHQSHNTMIQRELLYTAVTRAREELYCICEPDSFEKGINGQRIKGNTLAEKADFFKGKLETGEESLLGIINSTNGEC